MNNFTNKRLFNIDQNCKHYFYLSVIDKNQHLYEKTDYLFVDFIFSEYSYDDTYPVFKEMLNQNYPVHYMTENQYIYNAHCARQAKCESILYATRANYTISGDFLEKYLTLFLKLKAVVCSRQLNFYSNVFYITDYIQWRLDLDETNKNDKPLWYISYQASKLYNVSTMND